MAVMLRSFLFVLFTLVSTFAAAQDLSPKALRQPVLDVSAGSQDEKCAVKFRFTREMLMSLPQTEIVTTTIWTDETVTFKGVPLLTVINATGLSGTEISAWAINDYMAMFEMNSDITQNALIATTMNGKAMHARDKGPLWIVFPYDSDPKFQTEAVFAQSIWQLNRLEIQ